MPFSDPKQPKGLRIQLSIERHKALKMLAVKLDTTMDKLVNQLIKDKIDKEEKNE